MFKTPSIPLYMDQGRSNTSSKGSSRFSRYFLSDLHIELDLLVESELVLLTFTTGMQDAASFPDFHCFASNQTGNTVLLATVAAGLTEDFVPLANIATSLAMFLAGALIMGQIGNIVGRRRRLWLLLNSTLQTGMVFEASAMQYSKGDGGRGPIAVGVIALLAFSAGAQVTMSRAMEVPEITTAMATAAWVDLVIDPDVLAKRNRSRNRRALFLLALIAGSLSGAFAYKRVGPSFVLLIAAVGKAIVTAGLLVNKVAVSVDLDQVREQAVRCPVHRICASCSGYLYPQIPSVGSSQCSRCSWRQ